jgi:ADP-ribose pyrophosphatase YjhB (NUDIX family)
MTIPDFVRDLRARAGDVPLWLPGVTAVIRRDEEILLVRRADNGRWAPVTGIVDPGEEPAACAVREAHEETGVVIRVDRLASVSAVPEVTYPNGDRAAYLDCTFACTWVEGEAHVADDESTDVRWWPVDGLPAFGATMASRIEAALSGESTARFTA